MPHKPDPRKTKDRYNADPAQKKIVGTPTLAGLARLVQDCKACDLWQRGTQAVFGKGSHGARVMLVGEVPGDQEDLAGKPFVHRTAPRSRRSARMR
jgi:DNA polymerase